MADDSTKLVGEARGNAIVEAARVFYKAKEKVAEQIRALEQIARDLGIEWCWMAEDTEAAIDGISGARRIEQTLLIEANSLWEDADQEDGWPDYEASVTIARAALLMSPSDSERADLEEIVRAFEADPDEGDA